MLPSFTEWLKATNEETTSGDVATVQTRVGSSDQMQKRLNNVLDINDKNDNEDKQDEE